MRSHRLILTLLLSLSLSSQGCLSPSKTEAELGRAEAEKIARTVGIVDDPALAAYVQAIGERLAVHARLSDVPYRFQVVDMPEPNAFALPARAGEQRGRARGGDRPRDRPHLVAPQSETNRCRQPVRDRHRAGRLRHRHREPTAEPGRHGRLRGHQRWIDRRPLQSTAGAPGGRHRGRARSQGGLGPGGPRPFPRHPRPG